MKIFYAAGSKVPSTSANSIQVMQNCEALARQGAEVTLYCRHGGLDVESEFEYYGVERKFEIEKFYPEQANFGSLGSYWKLVGLLRKHQPDHVYGRHIRSLIVAAAMGYPTTVEVHNPMPEGFLELCFKFLVGRNNFRGIVSITEELKRFYVEQYSLSEDLVEVIPNSAPQPADVEPEELQGNFDFNVGYVGSLKAEKGIGLILDLAGQLPDVGFHIIGGNQGEISEWKKKQNPGNLYFYGRKAPVATEGYRKACDALLAPFQRKEREEGSKNRVFNSPLKLFEYMASEKPVLASDLPVLREVLEDGGTGILCAPDSTEDWKRAIQKLREDQEYTTRLGKQAFDLFQTKYSHEARAKRLLGVVS